MFLGDLKPTLSTPPLPALERANLDADFLEALAELYPTCEAFYFQNCGKLFLAEDVRSHQIEGPDRFIRFGVNVRFFNIEGTEDMLIDTVGMSTLFLPDLQYLTEYWLLGQTIDFYGLL